MLIIKTGLCDDNLIDWNYFLKKGVDGNLFYEGYKNSLLYHGGKGWENRERLPLGISEATFKLKEGETETRYPVGVFNVTMFDNVG